MLFLSETLAAVAFVVARGPHYTSLLERSFTEDNVNEKALLGALCQIDSFTYSSIFLTDKAKTRKNPSITVQWQGTPSDRMFANASEVFQMVFSKL